MNADLETALKNGFAAMKTGSALDGVEAAIKVLEDSPRGIASAQAAGCPVIAVPSMPLPAGTAGAGPPGAPARMVVASLREVDLARLRRVVISCADGV